MLPLQLTVELTTTDHDSLISLVQKYPSVICYSSQPYSRSTKTFFRNLPLTGLLTMHILPGPCQRRRIYFNKENNASKRTAAVSCMLSPTKIPLSPDKLQKHPCLWWSIKSWGGNVPQVWCQPSWQGPTCGLPSQPAHRPALGLQLPLPQSFTLLIITQP